MQPRTPSTRAAGALCVAALIWALLAHAALAQAPAAPAPGAPVLDVTDIENGGRYEPHKVIPGECFARIAQRYGVPVEDVVKANPGVDPARLQVGQTLVIPSPRKTAPAPASMPEPPAIPGAGPTRQYQVAPGDVLDAIAARFGLTAQDILDVNEGLDPRCLAIGQTLSIPAAPEPKNAPVTTLKTLEQPPQAPLVTDFQ